jgi:hypothetical protein
MQSTASPGMVCGLPGLSSTLPTVGRLRSVPSSSMMRGISCAKSASPMKASLRMFKVLILILMVYTSSMLYPILNPVG